MIVRIGELARRSGLSTKTLRFYEVEGLLPEPPRTPGGYRDYPPDTVDRLKLIRRGQAAGLALTEIKTILAIRDGGRAPCSHVRELLTERLAGVSGLV